MPAPPPTQHLHVLQTVLAFGLVALFAGPTVAQQPSSPAPGASSPAAVPPSAPAAPAASSASSASAPAAQRVEITGGRASDSEERRRSTAAKIVIGREDIERYGDTSTSELLRRLPGITTPGAPGRGGPPRMRGLAGGYTQILLDGQRVPPGFSLDSVPPEQIERIEILRAPTAETGARAIGGTINIITREGFRKRLNDVRLGTQFENGHSSGGISWTRNDALSERWTYNFSLSAFKRAQANESSNRTESVDLLSGAPLLSQTGINTSRNSSQGLHATGRLQWRGEQGDSLMLMPMLIANDSLNRSRNERTQSFGALPLAYALAESQTDSRFTLARLNAQVAHRLPDSTRAEWRAGAGDARWRGHTVRNEFDASGAPLRNYDDTTFTDDLSATLNLKLSRTLENEHSLVASLEFEANRRTESRVNLLNGLPQPGLEDFGENLQASSRRVAIFAQDEWNVSPQWALHGGLRWEGIVTRGDDGVAGNGDDSNRSKVLTPLFHTVWKFDPKSRDQIRLSMTRSYKAPTLQQLIARPTLNRTFPAPGPNQPIYFDRAGNPDLKPELARGIDLAVERFLPEGGVLSANLFQRNIKDLIRDVVMLENVSWAAVPRWVRRPQNIGDAVTRGIELEAKFRLSDFAAAAPKVDLRANASLFRSSVQSVPGPDNRLAEQPGGTLNLGADYKLSGLPLTMGANLNWTPGYTTRLSESETVVQNTKRVFDAYLLWAFNPEVQLRLGASNLAPRDSVSSRSVEEAGARQTSDDSTRTFVNWQLRLEMKL